jgi:hypothetical protein
MPKKLTAAQETERRLLNAKANLTFINRHPENYTVADRKKAKEDIAALESKLELLTKSRPKSKVKAPKK